MNKLKTGLYLVLVVASVAGTVWVQRAFRKIRERDDFARQNKALQVQVNTLADSVARYKELAAKAYIEQKNALELQGIKQDQIQLLQGLIKPMRDTVLAASKARLKAEAALLECQKQSDRQRTGRSRRGP
ncbi:hypothetical protein [Emticicia sp. 17c]|uniref:hypothetical protein n=1 Tax=Emticicia sp. 17c TaxID=3127704 RepID=UPI00301D3EBD